MIIAVLNYQTGKVDILENVPDENELTTYFIEHPIEEALHKLTREDNLLDFIEAYLTEICHYHLSEIDWMIINGINQIDMKYFSL